MKVKPRSGRRYYNVDHCKWLILGYIKNSYILLRKRQPDREMNKKLGYFMKEEL